MQATTRIDKQFELLEGKGEKALVGFVTAGDPDMETSLAVIKEMCEAGLDVLELGIPFSDPTADGPVIQRSSERALKAGMSVSKVLAMVKAIREFTEIPIILFSYVNPIHAMGYETFAEKAKVAGADGILMVDMPPEESCELDSVMGQRDMSVIRLIAPTTYEKRIRMISASASGFLYLISMVGVTGSGGLDAEAVKANYSRVKKETDLPVCVGFGISTPDDVAAIARFSDGVVIGSAFERLIEKNMGQENLPQLVGQKTRAYKEATRL